MSPERIKAAAARNVAKRKAAINGLRPTAVAARQTADDLHKAARESKGMTSSIELASKFKWVEGFFPTPKNIVRKMVEFADLKPGETALEPSAGLGHIADALKAAGAEVECIEINQALATELSKKGHYVISGDFLNVILRPIYSAVVMNPPFERKKGIGSQDEAHIRHAWQFLKPGGQLVAIACAPTGERLKTWVEQEHGGWVVDLPDGTFRTSDRPTGVRTVLIFMRKESE